MADEKTGEIKSQINPETNASPDAAQHAPRSRSEEGRGGRGPQREPGGFRIRLSDNEMRAVRAVQDAFQLRSPVAALGFSVRTLGQMLEQGQLDDLVAQQRSQGGGPGGAPGGGGGRRGEAPRGEGGGNRGGGNRRPWGEERASRSPRIDPFARPQKPAPAADPSEPDEAAGREEPQAEPATLAPDQPDVAAAALETAAEAATEAPTQAPTQASAEAAGQAD